MHFLKKCEKSDIYNRIALFKKTKPMNIMLHNFANMQKICILKYTEAHTNFKMFVQSVKGKYKNVAMIFFIVTESIQNERENNE